VQYLAELQKTQAAFGLGGNASVRLLARNTGENIWLPITNEQVLSVQDSSQAKDFKDGQMVVAEVVGNNQVQSIQDAAKKIVNILQVFSRSQEKYKSAEEEVEQWKQSLNFQAQELHRREQEVERELQQIEELESKFEHERAELEQLRHSIELQKAQFDSSATALTSDQTEQLKVLVGRLSSDFTSPESLRTRIHSNLDLLNQRQEVLTGFWQDLDKLKEEAERQQKLLDELTEDLNARKAQWQQNQIVLADAQAELKAQRGILKLQENNMAMSRIQLDAQTDLYEQTASVIEAFGGTVGVDGLSAEEESRLQSMSIEELEQTILNLQADFDKLVNYSSAQEDELAILEGEIADLQSQIDKANQFERIELESDKEFKEEEYKLLEESVSGGRRSMQERLSVLNQQKAILDRRRGIVVESSPIQSLLPLLSQVKKHKTRQEEELRKMESQIEAVRGYTQQQQDVLERQTQEHLQQEQEIIAAEESQQAQIRTVGDLLGQISAQEKLLRPVQDIVDTLRPQLEESLQDLGNVSDTNDSSQVIIELKTAIHQLVAAAS
jgi:chromosome segregation ATPase